MKLKGNLAIYSLIAVSALLVVIYMFLVRGDAVTLTFSPARVSNFISVVLLVSVSIERGVEAFISPWRNTGVTKLGNELDALKQQIPSADPQAVANADANLQNYKGRTQQYAFAVVLTLSLLVVFAGVRVLWPFVDIVSFMHASYQLQQMFRNADIVLSAALFAGAANGIHSAINAYFKNGQAASKKREIERATNMAAGQPEETRAAWNLARLRLELYFDRNLTQVSAIFWLSAVVMFVGFGFILYGINRTLDSPTHLSYVHLIPGIITEFIGATFLFLYRATVEQAANNIKTLERINAVGMTVTILDSISPDAMNLQDRTKAEVVKLILGATKTS